VIFDAPKAELGDQRDLDGDPAGSFPVAASWRQPGQFWECSMAPSGQRGLIGSALTDCAGTRAMAVPINDAHEEITDRRRTVVSQIDPSTSTRHAASPSTGTSPMGAGRFQDQ
jgi:hypothetical protein